MGRYCCLQSHSKKKGFLDFPSYRFPCLDHVPTFSHVPLIFRYTFSHNCRMIFLPFPKVPDDFLGFPMIFLPFPTDFPRLSLRQTSALRQPLRRNRLARSSWKVESTQSENQRKTMGKPGKIMGNHQTTMGNIVIRYVYIYI